MNHRLRFLLLVLLAQTLFLFNMTTMHRRHHTAAAVQTIVVDVDAQHSTPVEIQASAGSEILFVRKAAIVGTDVTLALDNTDGGKTPLVSSQASGAPVPQGFTLLTRYRIDRSGTVNVIVSHKVPMPGAQPTTEAVKITGQ